VGERRIEYRPLASLRPNEDNVKLHSLDGIGASMARFGTIDIITLDERTGFIVSGHGRTESLTADHTAGRTPPEGVENRDGEWWVPVIVGWASRDDDEAAAATVALNRWTEKGGWNIATLLDQLGTLSAGPGLDGVGFDRVDLDDLRARYEEEQTSPPDDGDPWGFGDADRQVRSFMLDLPLDEYRWATATAARARDDYQVDSNAALFLAMLTEDAALASEKSSP